MGDFTRSRLQGPGSGQLKTPPQWTEHMQEHVRLLKESDRDL